MLAFLSYDPLVDIELGPLSISPHGVGIAVGFLLGARVMLTTTRRLGITDEVVFSMLTRAAVGAIIGARVAYVVNHLGEYDHPGEWFAIWNGGISLLGGIVGGVLAGATTMRSQGLSFWKVMDAAAPGLAIGIWVGRVGDLVVADHLGKPTDFFLGYECPGVETASPCLPGAGVAVHQPALYDLLFLTALVPLLLWLRRRGTRYDGFLILVFATCYGIARLVEDFYRIDVTHGTGLTGSQWTSVAAIVLAGGSLLLLRRTPWASGQGALASPAEPGADEPPPEPVETARRAAESDPE